LGVFCFYAKQRLCLYLYYDFLFSRGEKGGGLNDGYLRGIPTKRGGVRKRSGGVYIVSSFVLQL
jgi:hypothetical protein